MGKICFFLFASIVFLLFLKDPVIAQSKEEVSKTIEDINRDLDRAVVDQNISTLQKHYGDDFVFTHGTGAVDSKESWINNIKKLSENNRFTSREHDSTQVELHGDIGILTGVLSVTRVAKGETTKYALRYVRVYALRKKIWQLISHRTTREWHL